MATASFPFLTTYDPPGASEGSLDPLGLYQIADQLAMQLVPAIRERMLRIRFLTAMAVGSFVMEGMEANSDDPENSAYLVWEWLVVEALTREILDGTRIWGVAGTGVARRALSEHGYVDARSYLKTPRVFGFHGVYKPLAVHLGLLDVHLNPGPNAERLADAWAKGQGFNGIARANSLLNRWREAVRRSLNKSPPQTYTRWKTPQWQELAQAFFPEGACRCERRLLQGLLLAKDDRQLGALPELWRIQAKYEDAQLREEVLHAELRRCAPEYTALVEAIQTYESFARGIQDAFDVLREEAAKPDAQGYCIPLIARNAVFQKSVYQLEKRFAGAYQALGKVTGTAGSLQDLFRERFRELAEPMDAKARAIALCGHHEVIQQRKSENGKRPWFDRLGGDRIYIRQAYRTEQPEIASGRYLHGYRCWPIRRFWADLA